MSLLTRLTSKREAVSAPASGYRPVNLLPAETLERNRARGTARRFVIAGCGVAGVVAALWLAQSASIHVAEGNLAEAEEAQADARAQLEPLLPVKTFSAALTQQREIVSTSLAEHTSFSSALNSFGAAFPAGSSLRTLDAQIGPGCAGPDPFQPEPAIGCLTWTVSVAGEQQVRDLTNSLSTAPGLVSPYLTGAVRNESAFDASGTVNLNEQLLTGRFAEQVEEVAP